MYRSQRKFILYFRLVTFGHVRGNCTLPRGEIDLTFQPSSYDSDQCWRLVFVRKSGRYAHHKPAQAFSHCIRASPNIRPISRQLKEEQAEPLCALLPVVPNRKGLTTLQYTPDVALTTTHERSKECRPNYREMSLPVPPPSHSPRSPQTRRLVFKWPVQRTRPKS